MADNQEDQFGQPASGSAPGGDLPAEKEQSPSKPGKAGKQQSAAALVEDAPSGSAGTDSPDEKLKRLAEDIKESKDDLSETDSTLKSQEDHQKQLGTKNDEIKKIVADYKKALPGDEGLTEQREDHLDYSEKKTAMILAAIGKQGKKAAIDGKIKSVMDMLAELRSLKAAAETALQSSTEEYKAAKVALEAAIEDFDVKKPYQKGFEEKFKALKALISKIEKEEDGGDDDVKYGIMYYYVREFNNKLCDKTDEACSDTDSPLDTPEVLTSRLSLAWIAIFSSMDAYRTKKVDMETAERELNEAKVALKEKEESREKDILDKIKTLYTE